MNLLDKTWQNWKKLAEKIGDFQANLIFSLLYFLLITPIGLVSSFFTDYLKKGFPNWQEFEGNSDNLRELKEQA